MADTDFFTAWRTGFDGYMGTGSTALAARQNGRNYLGAEIAPEHFKTIQKRLSEQEV